VERKQYECNCLIIKKKKKIVHSFLQKEKLLNRNLNFDVDYVPLYCKSIIGSTREQSGTTLRFKKDDRVVSIIGFAQNTKPNLQSVGHLIV
jgi:hypothetical protein